MTDKRMIETGIDIIDIPRFAKAAEREQFVKKYFHQSEIDYATASAQTIQHLAARFAAKEAVRKVLLSRMDSLSWLDSWIENDKDGKPRLRLSEKVRQSVSIRHASVSLSHTKDNAIAIVLIEFE
jgi:holo-[acyl-carrier protein] synthase